MRTKHKIIISIILFALSIALCVCGVLLFNILPDVNTNGYTNPKDALVMTGVLFSFLFAFFGLCGSVGMLIYAFSGTDNNITNDLY